MTPQGLPVMHIGARNLLQAHHNLDTPRYQQFTQDARLHTRAGTSGFTALRDGSRGNTAKGGSLRLLGPPRRLSLRRAQGRLPAATGPVGDLDLAQWIMQSQGRRFKMWTILNRLQTLPRKAAAHRRTTRNPRISSEERALERNTGFRGVGFLGFGLG